MININQNRVKSLTTQWPKEKWQRTNNNIQNTAQKTKDWATRKPLKNRSELRCSTRVSKSCYASGTRRVTLVTNTVISHELGKDREVLTTSVLLKPHQSGRFGALKSDSTHHFFRNACTKSASLRFSQFSGCWLILSVYILMSFDFPFVRLLGVR